MNKMNNAYIYESVRRIRAYLSEIDTNAVLNKGKYRSSDG